MCGVVSSQKAKLGRQKLPVVYNTFKKTRFANVSIWRRVRILHDPDVHRKTRIPLPDVQLVYNNLTVAAELHVAAIAASLGVRNRG